MIDNRHRPTEIGRKGTVATPCAAPLLGPTMLASLTLLVHALLLAPRVFVRRDPVAVIMQSSAVAPAAVEPPFNPRHLTQMIKHSKSMKELVQLHEAHGASFNHIHVSASWITVGRLLNARSRASASKKGYTRFRAMPPSLYEALLPFMRRSAQMALAGDLTGRELANVVYGVGRSRIPEGAPRSALLDILALAAATRLYELKPQEISNIVWAYATANHPAPRLFDAVAKVAAARAADFNPQETSNIVWAYATAGCRAPSLFDELSGASLSVIGDFNPQNLANSCWAYAKCEHAAPRLFDAIAIATIEKLNDLNEQNLANVAWAFATANHAAPDLFNALAEAASSEARVGKLKPQELANMAWAFTTACHRPPRLYEALAETAAVRGVRDFKPQAVANTAWAYAFAGHSAPSLYDSLAQVGASQADQFRPRSMANTLWAYATAGRASPQLFDALAGVATDAARQKAFTTAELANIAWAYAVSGRKAPELFDAIADACTAESRLMRARELSMIAWSFATARHDAPDFFRELAHTAVWLAADDDCEFDPRTLSDTAWAFSSMGLRSKILFHALERAVVERRGEMAGRQRFDGPDLAKLAWAYAAVDQEAKELFDESFSASVAAQQTWFETDLVRLHVWHEWHRERGWPLPLTHALSERCRLAAEEQGQAAITGVTIEEATDCDIDDEQCLSRARPSASPPVSI